MAFPFSKQDYGFNVLGQHRYCQNWSFANIEESQPICVVWSSVSLEGLKKKKKEAIFAA